MDVPDDLFRFRAVRVFRTGMRYYVCRGDDGRRVSRPVFNRCQIGLVSVPVTDGSEEDVTRFPREYGVTDALVASCHRCIGDVFYEQVGFEAGVENVA